MTIRACARSLLGSTLVFCLLTPQTLFFFSFFALMETTSLPESLSSPGRYTIASLQFIQRSDLLVIKHVWSWGGGGEGGREMPIYEGRQCSFAVLQLWDLYPAGAFSHNFHFLLFRGVEARAAIDPMAALTFTWQHFPTFFAP